LLICPVRRHRVFIIFRKEIIIFLFPILYPLLWPLNVRARAQHMINDWNNDKFYCIILLLIFGARRRGVLIVFLVVIIISYYFYDCFFLMGLRLRSIDRARRPGEIFHCRQRQSIGIDMVHSGIHGTRYLHVFCVCHIRLRAATPVSNFGVFWPDVTRARFDVPSRALKISACRLMDPFGHHLYYMSVW
jgi:hypothetical protein